MTHDLIVFAEDWGGLPSSTQHLIKQLSKTRKVVWVNSIGLRRPTLSLHDLKRLWHKLTAPKVCYDKTELTSAPENSGFHIINPRTLPAPRSRTARYIAVQLLLSQIKPVIKKAGLNSPILWTSLPTAVDLAGHLDEAALVYYCGDDFSGLAGVDHDTVVKRENELRDKADLIMAASRHLEYSFPVSRTHLLTHGVDYSLFSAPVQRAPDLPDDGRNIAGFYGSISEWLNIELLRNTIRKMPDWHFVFIGKVVVDVSRISCFDNVSFLGERPHQQLPSYSQHWTASLLPFIDNAQIQACNPLKLTEYLAAGSPIICTSFAAVEPYRGLVQTANNSDAMVEALSASEHLHDLALFPDVLRSTVITKSWEARAAEVSTWLEAL
ncbi:glycosyltransferase [Psychromonas ossibalaenae]|uniref:glycosyltransferase n=1 Tax=Psychromonas ossibalaenae TaxID=444922 RepID=UPI00037DFA0A|nr:glycosyltransferase [Psychromonas ossibalaenae]